MLSVVLFLVLLPSVLSNCPSYAVQGFGGDTRCYVFKATTVGFVKGHDVCAELSGTLVSIPNVAVDTWIQSQTMDLFGGIGLNSFWIGANAFTNGTWSWNDGTPIGYKHWKEYQPATDATHICAAAYTIDGSWFSSLCSVERPFICIVPGTPTPSPGHVDPKRAYVADPTVPVNLLLKKEHQ
uniref:C-type lectin domain-containing protein n=1 Tax=Panagrolaimus sp. JU765 TaxID=591449 RepID=A0AC34Q6V3_9BILA